METANIDTIYILDTSTRITYFLKGVKSISPEMRSTITEYPVPEGGFVSDHIYADPNSLDFKMISDGLDTTRKSYSVDNSGQVTYLTYRGLKELLANWQSNGTRLDIQTMHGLFKNMVLTSRSWSESSSSWTKFAPSLSFKEVRIAHTYVTTLDALNVRYGADYSRETDSGDENGVESSAGSAALGGAAVGAVIGAQFGHTVIGKAIGAAVGGVVGAAVGFFSYLARGGN